MLDWACESSSFVFGMGWEERKGGVCLVWVGIVRCEDWHCSVFVVWFWGGLWVWGIVGGCVFIWR